MVSDLTAHLMTIMLMSSCENNLNDIKTDYEKKYCLKSSRKKDKCMKKANSNKKSVNNNKYGNKSS